MNVQLSCVRSVMVLMAIVLVGCGDESGAPKRQAMAGPLWGQLAENSPFPMKLPAGWRVKQMDVGVVQARDGQMRTRTGYVAVSGVLGADGMPVAQVTVMKKDDRAASPRALIAPDLPLLSQMSPSIEETELTVNEMPALRLQFTWSAEGQPFKSVIYAIVTSDGRGYTVRCDVNQDEYETYLGILESALNSFKAFN